MRFLLLAALCSSVFVYPALSQQAARDGQSFYGVIRVKKTVKEDKPKQEPSLGVLGDEKITSRKVRNSNEEWTFEVVLYNDVTDDVPLAPLVGGEEHEPVPLLSRTKQTADLTPLLRDEDLPEAAPLTPYRNQVAARVSASGDVTDELVNAATNVICWKDDGTAVHGASRTVTTTGKTTWAANRAEEARALLNFDDNGEYRLTLSAKAAGSATNEQSEKIKSTCGEKTPEPERTSMPWEIIIDFTSDPFKGAATSQRLTGKEILIFENGTMEVQWELRKRP